MVRSLELELQTYARERARLENEHRGKFVLIRGEEVAAIFDDFQSASKHAALRFRRESYLIHRIATEMTGASAFLEGLADGARSRCGLGDGAYAPLARGGR